MPDQNPLQAEPHRAEFRRAVSSFLKSLPTVPELLGLGESTHGDEAFPAARNRLFQALVEDHGFRSIALESDILAGQRVNTYILSDQGQPDEEQVAEVLQGGFSHGFEAYAANRELVKWLRQFNTGRAQTDQVHFYGFDPPLEWWAPSPAASLLALHDFLGTHLAEVPVGRASIEQLCGQENRWSNPAAVRDVSQAIGNTAQARELRLLADDLESLLATQAPQLAAEPGFWEAQLHARTAAGLLRYHAQMASPAPNRVERLSALRDLMMADNACAVREREQLRGPSLIFAHNSHLQRAISRMSMGQTVSIHWWGAGAHLNRRLGQQYAFIASLAAPKDSTETARLLSVQQASEQAGLLTSEALRQADGVLLVKSEAT